MFESAKQETDNAGQKSMLTEHENQLKTIQKLADDATNRIRQFVDRIVPNEPRAKSDAILNNKEPNCTIDRLNYTTKMIGEHMNELIRLSQELARIG
jgi:hypothetical protein